MRCSARDAVRRPHVKLGQDRCLMQAFVLGAGLGLRLRPLTEHLPKPLVPIYQKPLITFSFDHLIAAGCETFVVNTHPHPERFSEFFPTTTYRNRPIRLLHEPELLGTGGGIKNALPHLLGTTFVVHRRAYPACFSRTRPL